MSGSGISWDICKSAPRSRQITTPVPHHSIFYRPDARPAAQPTASKHWRQVTDNSTLLNYTHTHTCILCYHVQFMCNIIPTIIHTASAKTHRLRFLSIYVHGKNQVCINHPWITALMLPAHCSAMVPAPTADIDRYQQLAPGLQKKSCMWLVLLINRSDRQTNTILLQRCSLLEAGSINNRKKKHCAC